MKRYTFSCYVVLVSILFVSILQNRCWSYCNDCRLSDQDYNDHYRVNQDDYLELIKEKHRLKERFSDIFGHESVKKEAAKIVDMMKNHKAYRELGGKAPNLITIQGPKGSGRTLLAKAIAGESGAVLFFVDALPEMDFKLRCEFFSKLVKERPILVIDRGMLHSNKNQHYEDRYHNDYDHNCNEDTYRKNYRFVVEKIKKYRPSADEYPIMLIRMKELFDVQPNPFFFCCGGGGDDYDELNDGDKRGIREKIIYIPYPDKDGRIGLLKKFIKQKKVKLNPNLSLDELSLEIAQKTNSFGAFHIKKLVNEAALCAGRDYSLYGGSNNYVEKKHFEEAYHLIFRDIQTGKGGGTFFTEGFYFTHSEETRFSDVKGLDHILVEIKEFVDILHNPKKYKKIGVKRPCGLLLEGLPGVGKTLIARAIAGESGCCFISASASQFQNPLIGSGQQSIRALFNFARQKAQAKPVIIFIDEFDSIGRRPDAQDIISREYTNMINELLKQMDGFEVNTKIMVFAATNNAEKLDPAIVRDGRFDRKVYVPLPCDQGRKEILLHYMDSVTCSAELNKESCALELAKQCKGFSGANLRVLVNEAALLAIRSGADAIDKTHFLQAFEKVAAHAQCGIGGSSEEGFTYTFSEEKRFYDVIGIEEVLDEVVKFVDGVKYPEKYKEMGVNRPKGMLLYGKPGVGKTLLARAIAGEAGCCFIWASASQFVKLYVGSGALAVRRLFSFARKMAYNKPVLIFIDELDAFGKRGFGNGGCSQEYNNTINELLTQIDGFAQDERISVIGATNTIDLIDDALLRDGRFDSKLEVPLPRLQSRESILTYYLKRIKKLDPMLALDSVAHKWAKETTGYSGAALESFVTKAALLASYEGCEYVQEKHFEDAYVKNILGLKNNLVQTRAELEKIAYHEAGHTLISVLTGHEVSRVSILSRGHALGAMFQKDKHEVFSNNNRNDLLHEVIVLLGGFCAERLIYNYETPGAFDDLRKANKLISDMINLYGMGDGLLSGITSDFIKSDAMLQQFDRGMMSMLQQCMKETKDLLETNKDKLTKLAITLLEKETLLEDEIYAIIGKPVGISSYQNSTKGS